jgi:hypothetical protein
MTDVRDLVSWLPDAAGDMILFTPPAEAGVALKKQSAMVLVKMLQKMIDGMP